MKLGLVLPLFSGDPAKVLEVARESEAQGWDGVFVFDHLFPPGAPSDRPALEAFTTLAAVSAATERVEVGTLVTRASLRPVGLLAKTASWIDHASAGRLILGIGTGDPIDRPEHETYGIPMLPKRERREQLEETVIALKALFDGSRYEGGRHVPAVEGPLVPSPARSGGPPIWLGAQADEVVRMAARTADGWNGWGMDVSSFARKVELLRAEAARAGRVVAPTWAGIALVGTDDREAEELLERRHARGMTDEVWAGGVERFRGFLGELAAAGAEWAVFVVAGPADRRQLLAEQIVSSPLPAASE